MIMSKADLSRDETYILYGVRRTMKGFGYAVADKLDQRGYSFFIAHPEAEYIDRFKPVRHATDLPETPAAAILCTPKDQSRLILEELRNAGVQRVYAAAGSIDELGRNYARDHDLHIHEGCPLLKIPGLGFPHNFHRRLVSFLSSAAMD